MLGTESTLRSQLEGQHSSTQLFAKAAPANGALCPNGLGSPAGGEVASPSASDDAL